MTNTYVFVTNYEVAMIENCEPEINKLNAYILCPVSGMSSPYRRDITIVFGRII